MRAALLLWAAVISASATLLPGGPLWLDVTLLVCALVQAFGAGVEVEKEAGGRS